MCERGPPLCSEYGLSKRIDEFFKIVLFDCSESTSAMAINGLLFHAAVIYSDGHRYLFNSITWMTKSNSFLYC